MRLPSPRKRGFSLLLQPIWILPLTLALSGCIPRSPGFSGDQAPQLATDMKIVSGELPVWVAAPATARATPIAGGTYVVQSGDTLSGIGERSGAGFAAIAQANALSAPYSLRTGQTLAIPSGRFHRVAAGESGIAIARAYSVAWPLIVEANALSEPFTLKVGQRLLIPNANPAEAPSLETRASAFKLDIDDILTGGEPAQDEGYVSALPTTLPGTAVSPRTPVSEPGSFAGSFGWPVQGKLIARFGPAGEGRINEGIEIATAPAAPILASADGVVAFVGNDVPPYGGMILIRHGSGWISAYGRAASTSVARGQKVKRGDVIGNTGTGSGPQLHFQLRQKRTPVDPLGKLPTR
jgi:murein DD-endopeptidase MepM/ murein hydrolase activator NlpD